MNFYDLIELDKLHWVWIGLGCLLLVGEMLGASGYLLWSGLAAIVLGCIIWILPFEVSFSTQATAYAVILILNTYLWWKWLKHKLKMTNATSLNQINRQLSGRRALLMEDVTFGISRIKIADSSWRVQCEQPLKKGDEVIVTDINGTTLIVKKWP